MVSNRKNPSPVKANKFRKKVSPMKSIRPSPMGSTVKTTETNMKVIVRVRPPNERESQDNFRNIINVVDDQMMIFDPKGQENPFFYRGLAIKGRDLLKKQNKELQFIFDRVFGDNSTNEDVFINSTKDMMESLLDGYNCSVFAYGATGAGKTHTMLGKEEEPGITYLTMVELFAQMDKFKEEREFNLGVTYLEIYNEIVQDLLHKAGQLQLREDGRNGVVVTGLKIIEINNAEELFDLLSKGNRNRTQFATDANGESSRSHAVFQVYISMKNKLDGQMKCVKLSMIDLAGSERASATGCKGDRFKEGANINKSLLALGNCINSLSDGTKHIPYRDSKLTRLLKDSLGGNCQTVMIANIGPSSVTYDDTYNTLRYADRAKKIKTTMKKNIVSCQMHVTGYIKIIEELKKENALLKSKNATLEANGVKPVRAVIPEDNQKTKLAEEVTGKLRVLWDKKRLLHEKLLSLESQDKILCFRMSYKRAAEERLRYLTAVTNPLSDDEYNASGKSRLKKSFEHFKRQRDSIRIQLQGVWDDLVKIEEEIKQINVQIKDKNLGGALAKDLELFRKELKECWLQQQNEHIKRVSSLQQCERHTCAIVLEDACKTLQDYYFIMCGQGNLTESMKLEFKAMVKKLEGVRSIKWQDAIKTKEEEDFYNMTSLSIKHLEDPLNTEPISIINYDIEGAKIEPSAEIEPPAEISSENIPNSPTSSSESSQTQENEKNDQQLNDTFNLELTKNKNPKKRVLIDQNESRAKAIKLSHGTEKVATSGKENGTAPFRSMMSAKSIAILNKMKQNRLQQGGSAPKPVEKERNPVLVTKNDSQVKTMQKTKKVLPTASSRVPW